MKINMEMVLKIHRIEESSDYKQVAEIRKIISNQKAKEKYLIESTKDIEDALDCVVEILSCDIIELPE